MRKYTEPTARNLLRRPLVLGVPLVGLILLSFGVLVAFVLGGTSGAANFATILIGVVGYGVLRVLSKFSKSGWEESIIFPLERITSPKIGHCSSKHIPADFELSPPDTLEPIDLINLKDALPETLKNLKPGARKTYELKISEAGATAHELLIEGKSVLGNKTKIESIIDSNIPKSAHLYSLYSLPVTTDPLWVFSILNQLPSTTKVWVSFLGQDPIQSKKRIEHSRRSNAQLGQRIVDIDSQITFEESSRVLEGISRGDEGVVEAALVIASPIELALDPSLFCKEKNRTLVLSSILGLRRRLHRGQLVRFVTAADLIPSICDPAEAGSPILSSLREAPLYFNPQDYRLEALHWLVVGASGSGKSFFTALVLKRMLDAKVPMSVIFIDHNRSFRRVVRAAGQNYHEPSSLADLTKMVPNAVEILEQPGSMTGIELSDLANDEKKEAIHFLLSKIENYLRNRKSLHPVYLVLDECWNFMRDEPVLVQRAFREFRKLNGAVIAITQSLFDFLTDPSGQSIFQNAPVRILLRQGEDLSRYQGALSLNSVELEKVRRLKQRKGTFSECLIKTPFLSRIGRLYPTNEEHALLRTDNIREEMIQESIKERVINA